MSHPQRILHCRRLRAVSDRPGTLRLGWNAGSGGGAEKFATFQLQFKDHTADAEQWITACDSIQGCEYTLHDLRGGAAYLVRVRHTMGGVAGAWVSASAAVPLPGAFFGKCELHI